MVISTVAATIPKIIAARSAVFPPRSFMPSFSPMIVRMAGAIAVALLAACSEPTTSIRRFAVLDDLGSGDWQTVTVGVEHSCGIKTTGDAFCWGNNQFGQLAVARIDTTCGSEKSLYRCSLSPQAVQAFFAHEFEGAKAPQVIRYDLPGLQALNLHCIQALGGGQFSSLRLDPLAKGKAQQLLDMEIEVPAGLVGR